MSVDSSIELYKELLKHTEELLVFLKNDKLFHNHFKFNEINEKCYFEMYENVKSDSEIPTLPELKKIIPNLDTLENEAYKFFIKPRNKSIKGLDVQKGNKRVLVTIEDDGPGIPEDQYKNVFKPFFRLDKSRSLNQSGVGLGLAIVEDIINSHGGNIQLGKSKFNGLQVKISLPF